MHICVYISVCVKPPMCNSRVTLRPIIYPLSSAHPTATALACLLPGWPE